MARPELRQFGELTPGDFERHPVWIGVHGLDEDEPWYDDTDEETFRPWDGDLPVEASEGMLLVRAKASLPDGSELPAFITPGVDESDGLGILQPQIFVGTERFSFWGGMFGVPVEERAAFYEALARSADDVFPIEFSTDPGLATGLTGARVEGFYSMSGDDVSVER